MTLQELLTKHNELIHEDILRFVKEDLGLSADEDLSEDNINLINYFVAVYCPIGYENLKERLIDYSKVYNLEGASLESFEEFVERWAFNLIIQNVFTEFQENL